VTFVRLRNSAVAREMSLQPKLNQNCYRGSVPRLTISLRVWEEKRTPVSGLDCARNYFIFETFIGRSAKDVGHPIENLQKQVLGFPRFPLRALFPRKTVLRLRSILTHNFWSTPSELRAINPRSRTSSSPSTSTVALTQASFT